MDWFHGTLVLDHGYSMLFYVILNKHWKTSNILSNSGTQVSQTWMKEHFAGRNQE